MKHMVKDLLEVGYWDKKSTDKKMKNILANICFAILDPYSQFVYRTGNKETELAILTNHVFNKIHEALKLANKSKTYEEFCDVIFEPVFYVKVIMEAVDKRMPFLDVEGEDPKLLVETMGSLQEIYTRFYDKKKRRAKRRKNVRKQQGTRS